MTTPTIHPPVTIKTIPMDPELLATSALIDPILARMECFEEPNYLDFTKKSMRIDLRTWIMQRTVQGITFTVPANWWEGWKENAYRRGYLGPWAKRLWPVLYAATTLEAREVFPDLVKPPMRSMVMHLADPFDWRSTHQ